jgi:hypothetical protein
MLWGKLRALEIAMLRKFLVRLAEWAKIPTQKIRVQLVDGHDETDLSRQSEPISVAVRTKSNPTESELLCAQRLIERAYEDSDGYRTGFQPD